MKANSARKNSSATQSSAPKHRRVIQLDESLYAVYKNGTIDILTPNGDPVDYIGNKTTLLNKFGA